MNPKIHFQSLKPGPLNFGPRRAVYYDIQKVVEETNFKLELNYLANLEAIDLVYRTMCAILYNFVPTSGHPGGSLSSGRIVESLIYSAMDYDFSAPQKEHADILVYAAGHKAMGRCATNSCALPVPICCRK